MTRNIDKELKKLVGGIEKEDHHYRLFLATLPDDFVEELLKIADVIEKQSRIYGMPFEFPLPRESLLATGISQDKIIAHLVRLNSNGLIRVFDRDLVNNDPSDPNPNRGHLTMEQQEIFDSPHAMVKPHYRHFRLFRNYLSKRSECYEERAQTSTKTNTQQKNIYFEISDDLETGKLHVNDKTIPFEGLRCKLLNFFYRKKTDREFRNYERINKEMEVNLEAADVQKAVDGVNKRVRNKNIDGLPKIIEVKQQQEGFKKGANHYRWTLS